METRKVVLKSVSNSDLTISQSNKLIESRYSLSVGEQRLVLTLISLISPEDEDFKDYEIKVSDFREILDIKTKRIHEKVKETLGKLGGRVIYIPIGKNYLMTHWFSSAFYDHKKGSISISFDKKLKPYLLKLKEQFTSSKLLVVTQFKSIYTIRLYMLLKQYEKLSYRKISVDDLRNILDISDNNYSDFKRFRARVINQAKKEFETKDKETGCYKSDITFDLETERTGRKISHLIFIIKKQKYQPTLPLDIPNKPAENPKSPAEEKLAYYGIVGKTAEKHLKEQTEAEILRCVEILEETREYADIKNVGGYLNRLLERKAGTKSPAEIEAEEEAKRQEKIRKEKARKEREAKERERQKEQYQKAMYNEVDGFLLACDTEKKAEIIADFEASDIFLDHIKSAGFLYGFYQQNGIDDPISKSFFSRFIINQYLPHLNSFDNWLVTQKENTKR